MNLHELAEVLRTKLTSPSAKILLVTKDLAQTSCDPRLTHAARIPQGTTILQYRLVIFVRPFDREEAEAFSRWVKKAGCMITVCFSAESITEVRKAIEERLASRSLSLNKWTPPPFDPTDPSWRIIRGRVARFAETYGNPRWENAQQEGRNLVALAKQYGLGGTAQGYAEALAKIRKEKGIMNQRKRTRQGDAAALVLKHINPNRKSDHGEGLRLHRYFKDKLGIKFPISTMKTIIPVLVKAGLIPRKKEEESISDWVCANVNPSYKKLSEEARALKEKAEKDKKPWQEDQLYNRLRSLVKQNKVPRPGQASA